MATPVTWRPLSEATPQATPIRRTSSPRATRPRIIGLDGIRALAAVLVLLYHLVPGWRGAGFVGVDIFFVLSGFLITSLLLREVELKNRIGFKNFWIKRFRRLLPAVVFLTIGAVALARVFGGDAIVQLRWQSFGALTSTYNWLEIANSSPYFDQKSPLLLTNMWSLAVEMQFYLIWPLMLVAIVVFAPPRIAPYVAIGLAVLSAAFNFYIVQTGDLTRAYVGTDSHAFGLMIGAAIALWVPRVMIGDMPRLPASQRHIWGILAWVGLAGALLIGIVVPVGPWMYPWGMVAASILTGLTIRGLLPDATNATSLTLGRFLHLRPLRWLGERSYSIYLWHWPLWVIAFFTLRWSPWPTAALVLALTMVMAEVSYRFVETPIRTRGLKPWVAQIEHLAPRARNVLLVGTVVVALLFGWALASSPAQSSAQKWVEDAAAQQSGQGEAASGDPTSDLTAGPLPVAAPDPETLNKETAASSSGVVAGDQVTIIGDSVTLVSIPQLEEALPGVFIDAEVSRPMSALPEVVEQVRAAGELREYVVVSLAINGFVGDQEMQAMFDAIGPDHKIVLVTGYGPESEYWIFEANAKIDEVAAAHADQVRVADWEPIAATHLENLAGDRTHPDGIGATLYTEEIVRALNNFG